MNAIVEKKRIAIASQSERAMVVPLNPVLASAAAELGVGDPMDHE